MENILTLLHRLGIFLNLYLCLFCSGMDSRPPGGFLSYFQDPSSLQNHQPSIPLNYYATQQAAPWAPSPAEYRSPVTKSGPGEQHPINIDSGGEETPTVRTEKRLTWSTEEDIRLVSK